MSTCILVTGVPYSGKSIIAGTLHHLGVFMGTFRRDPEIYNRGDIYEDKTLVNLNTSATNAYTDNHMLSAAHACLNNASFTYNDIFETNIASVAKHRSEKFNIWGFKDPRLLFPNLMVEFLEIVSGHSTIKLICSVRKLEDIAKCYSMCKDDQEYVKNAIYYFSGRNHAIFDQANLEKMKIGFDAPLRRPEEFVQSMADFAEMPVTENALAFVQGRNRRAEKDGKP